jgi:hypothetical protein
MSSSEPLSPWNKIAPFALIALVLFGFVLLLVVLMVWQGDRFIALGFTDRFYYILLVPVGLAAALILFGVLESYARYSGHKLGGVLKLGGPIVGFGLVVILGCELVPNVATFPLTVYVYGPGGRQDIVLSNSGEAFMDLGPERRHVAIGDQGQAYFPAIPADFRSQEVPIWVRSDKFESVDLGQKFKLASSSVYVPVRRKAGHVYGRIDSENKSCIAGAEIRVAGLVAPVDPISGRFELNIPGDRMQDQLPLQAIARGCVSQQYNVVPDSNEVVVTLRRSDAR